MDWTKEGSVVKFIINDKDLGNMLSVRGGKIIDLMQHKHVCLRLAISVFTGEHITF